MSDIPEGHLKKFEDFHTKFVGPRKSNQKKSLRNGNFSCQPARRNADLLNSDKVPSANSIYDAPEAHQGAFPKVARVF
jgi:hypothetical protein